MVSTSTLAAAEGVVASRPTRSPGRPRVLLVFPSTSTGIMAGSIGELTALVRLARSLPRRHFRISYAEFLRSPWDPHPRVDRLLSSLRGRTLFSMERGQGGVEVHHQPQRGAPDAIVLASFRAFFQYPKFPRLVEGLLGYWQEEGIPVLTLDPCGDSFAEPIPPGVSVIVPQPFTYGEAPDPAQIFFSAGDRVAPRRRRRRWLWAAAPWMEPYARYRAAERLAFFGLARLGVEMSVLSPLDPALPFLGQAHRIEENLGYAQLDAEVARHDLVITANCRSVLAARAAAMGVPVALVDPARLPLGGMYDPLTNELLRTAGGERLPPAPLPLEFRQVPCGLPEETLEAFRDLERDLGALRERQLARCRDYEKLPGAKACIEQVLTHRSPGTPISGQSPAGGSS